MTDGIDDTHAKSIVEVVGEETSSKYSAPTLVVYGTVVEFTKGTATVGTDGAPFNNSRKNPQSDRAVKENIVRVGDHPRGFGLYLFDYKAAFRDSAGFGRQFGVMADEVEPIVPDAVSVGEDGYRRVDYSKLGILHPAI